MKKQLSATLRLGIIMMLSAVLLPLDLHAQMTRSSRPLSIEELLLLLPSEVKRETSSTVAEHVLPRLTYGWDSLLAPVRDSLFTGLETLAIRHEDSPVRRGAITLMSLAGRRDNPMPGLVAHLERIYDGAGDNLTRLYVVNVMGRQGEENAAALFLRRVVLQDPSHDLEPDEVQRMQERALDSLSRLGTAGRSMLHDLHVSGRVHDPRVRHLLRQIVETTGCDSR
jgi:hypothetical protein